MVDAGFYYKGSGDRVLCFYCDKGLFYWKPRDNPWYKHAKWFPICEFVLEKQGVNYVEKFCQKHSDLHQSNIKTQLDPLQQTAYVACCSIKCKTQLQQSKRIKHWKTLCGLILM